MAGGVGGESPKQRSIKVTPFASWWEPEQEPGCLLLDCEHLVGEKDTRFLPFTSLASRQRTLGPLLQEPSRTRSITDPRPFPRPREPDSAF